MDKKTAYLETLATLRRDLSEAEAHVRKLREAIQVIEQLVPQEELFPSSTSQLAFYGHTPVRLAGLSQVAAAEALLEAAGQPMHVMDLANVMLRQGFSYEGDSKALRASLTGSLERKSDVFERVAPATYGLRVWSKNGQKIEEAGAAE